MKKFILFLLVVMAISCTDTIHVANTNSKELNLTWNESRSLRFSNPETLTDGEVIDLARNFATRFCRLTRSETDIKANVSRRYFVKGSLKSTMQPGSQIKDSILFCVVDLVQNSDSGYAVVSADERVPGVVAYVWKGNFDARGETGAEAMLKLGETAVMEDVMRLDTLVENNIGTAMEKIKEYMGGGQLSLAEAKTIAGYGTRKPVSNGDLPTIQYAVLPVTHTQWSQGNPYNLYLPECYITNSFGVHMKNNYPAGCGVVAAAQALAAVAPNNIVIDNDTIDWNYLTRQPKVDYNSYGGGDAKAMKMVATLYRDMYEKTGSVAVIDTAFKYGRFDDTSLVPIAGSTVKARDLMTYLKKYVNCGDFINKYDADALLETMNANQQFPSVAIMGASRRTEDGGEGSHAWVIDGYAVCDKTSRELVKAFNVYFHANMGWNGTDDGYYLVKPDTSLDFETENGTYNFDFWEIPEIYRYR